jgi:hypothetical protein
MTPREANFDPDEVLTSSSSTPRATSPRIPSTDRATSPSFASNSPLRRDSTSIRQSHRAASPLLTNPGAPIASLLSGVNGRFTPDRSQSPDGPSVEFGRPLDSTVVGRRRPVSPFSPGTYQSMTVSSPTFSPSDSDIHAEDGASPFQKATPEELDHLVSLQITRDRAPSPNDLPSLLPGMNDKPRRVPEEDDNGEGLTEHRAKLVAPDASSEKEVARLEHERIADLERQLSETLAAQTERDRHIVQLTDQLAQESTLLKRAEANAAEEKKRAGLELHELQAKLDELLLSRDHALKQAEENAVAEESKRAGLELCELQAQLDDLLLSRDYALERANADAAEERKRAGLELRELQAKLDESLLSCDHALEQAQSALQKASYVAEANQQSQRELSEMRAELEAKMSESALALRVRLADMERGYARDKVEAETYRTQTATALVNTDELMERM